MQFLRSDDEPDSPSAAKKPRIDHENLDSTIRLLKDAVVKVQSAEAVIKVQSVKVQSAEDAAAHSRRVIKVQMEAALEVLKNAIAGLEDKQEA